MLECFFVLLSQPKGGSAFLNHGARAQNPVRPGACRSLLFQHDYIGWSWRWHRNWKKRDMGHKKVMVSHARILHWAAFFVPLVLSLE